MKRFLGITLTALTALTNPVIAGTTTMGETNDGALLNYDPDVRPALDRKSGLTVFGYVLTYPGKEPLYRKAATPFCHGGQVKQNPRANVVMSNPGWYAIRPNGQVVAVDADSEASYGLLETICDLANQQ
ncbi:hypothetical protein [Nostoc sp. FACHB-145]|uniref:hypothetical protein n=1 Tax=Nostoc sp. FACHB-145 TaxID=2692836 RepID=UPI0016836DB2|nr:hypothetical protein [Nostoc sp. FACHB-145]MBD2471722.1 hypothetical protein [Nostoc sp. FACHB-145]